MEIANTRVKITLADARRVRFLNDKSSKVENASVKPRRYFGLHMVDGTAEYEEDGKDPYKIFINEKTIREMGPSFEGCPVFVDHVEEVDLGKIQVEADGYVVKSFYNAADGKHWVEFMVVSDRGHEAIGRGWKLSNAYIPTQFGPGGEWNGMRFEKEVLAGEFEHLAIVDNPRYAESKILTPEQFKTYNDELQVELRRVANSKTKGEVMSKFKFWEKKEVTKIENASDVEKLTVTLPKSKKELTVGELVENMDTMMMPDQYANGDHKVKVGEEEMTVNDLVKKHLEMCNKMGSGEQGEDAAEDKDAEHAALGNEDEEEEDKPAKDKKQNSGKASKKEEDEEEGEDHFASLQNADKNAKEEETFVETSHDRVTRGKTRYGS